MSPATDHLLAGVTAPIVTPLSPTGRPSPDAVFPLLERLAAAGVNSLLVLGTNGEGPCFPSGDSAHFAAAVTRQWRRLAADRGRSFVAVFGSSTAETLARAEAICAAEPPDALVVTPPHYFHYNATELVDHYETVAAAAPVPVVIYNAPRYTGNLLTAPVIADLSNVDNIVGLKDSSGDDAIVLAALAASFSRPAFGVSQGNERRLAWALCEGAVGITPGLANLAPVPCVALYGAVVRGELHTAEECQAELDAVGTMHTIRPGVACMKAALSLVGLCPPAPAAPATAYTFDELERLRVLLAATGARLM